MSNEATAQVDASVSRTAICNTCGLTEQKKHDCALVLLARSRWLILHYAHMFNEVDKKEALPLVEQIAGLLTLRGKAGEGNG